MYKQVIVFLMLMVSVNCFATTHRSTVATVHSPDNRPCAFFRLDGVNQADPITPNVPWFSVPTSHPGFDMIVTLLITAKITGRTVIVRTTSTSQCGHVTVHNMELL